MKTKRSPRKSPVRKAAKPRSKGTAANISSKRQTEAGSTGVPVTLNEKNAPIMFEAARRQLEKNKYPQGALIPFDVPQKPFPWRETWATLILIAATAILIWTIATGMDAQDRADCLNWQQEATQLQPLSPQNPGGFYLTKDESEQCQDLGISVAAPVQ